MPLEAGNSAPSLPMAYPDQDGTERSIDAMLTNGPVVVGLYKSSCAASKAMMPLLNRLKDRYGEQGLSVVGVAQDSANVTRSFIRRTGVDYPVLIEGDEYPISRAFDIFATPTVYVIERDGKITYSTMGFFRQQVNDIGAAAAKAVGAEPGEIVGENEDDIPRFVPG